MLFGIILSKAFIMNLYTTKIEKYIEQNRDTKKLFFTQKNYWIKSGAKENNLESSTCDFGSAERKFSIRFSNL